MGASTRFHAVQDILAPLGYPDPMMAVRQQARRILLGRQSRYQALTFQFEAKWGCTLEQLRARYVARGIEDASADDGYLDWQWSADAVATIDAQLAVLES